MDTFLYCDSEEADAVSSALNAPVQSTLRRHSVMAGLGKYPVMRLIAVLMRQAIYALVTLQMLA